MNRSGSFRASVQPLVRETATRGGSISDLTAQLRERYGHAYRRADMLADLRRHRASDLESSAHIAASTITSSLATIARTVDHSRYIARAGVVVFAMSLLLPTLVSDFARGRGVLVASANDASAASVVDFSLPNQVAVLPRRIVTPDPTPAPTPPPTPVPTPVPTPTPIRLVPGGPGVLVTASWYGPGFFENRLPCWQWLQANGLPIQFQPDTWGVAHKTLPCGTMLVLTHGPNTITVPVVDRGPYVAGRELDLSPRVKASLGCTDLCTVFMQLQ